MSEKMADGCVGNLETFKVKPKGLEDNSNVKIPRIRVTTA